MNKINPIAKLILDNFTELSSELSDYHYELPYLVANELAKWYDAQVGLNWISAQMRIRAFYAMAASMPGGSDASNDIMTILQVGFFEKLWRESNAVKTIPTLAKKADLVRSKDYLIQWVGADKYESVLKSMK